MDGVDKVPFFVSFVRRHVNNDQVFCGLHILQRLIRRKGSQRFLLFCVARILCRRF